MPNRQPSPRRLKQAMQWFVRLQAEDCPQEDYLSFSQWLAAAPENRAAYAEAERVWAELDGLKTVPRSRLADSRFQPSPRAETWLGKSAALLLTVAASLAWLDYSAPLQTYATGLGERRSLTLADGSHIDLNTATRLTARLSPLRRDIVLEQGEALFSVNHEALRPFRVHSGTLRIRDIGTRFDVRTLAAGSAVAVLEGEVELSDGDRVQGQRLRSGYRVHYQTGGDLGADEPVDAEQIAAWREGRLLFKHTPLAEVAAELERYHAVQIRFADPALARETISGSFDANDLAPFLNTLEHILPIRAIRTGPHILLRRAG